MVARPGVIGGTLAPEDAAHRLLGQSRGELVSHLLTVGCDDDEPFITGDDFCQLDESLGDVIDAIAPVGVLVRPSELYRPLMLPFCRHIKLGDAVCHKLKVL